ncbi:hypothetical protein [Brevibacillus brevis]|uniref:YozE SAM-like domain-containing protein n=1 Tax=Brevibacillus brevis TaxID=1393 RepID=A0ABY9TDB8_BREBE|nr:hypothetical protein [Brevibacillus brevis]WNC17882.1 hypothetical protein RGB73_30400 [Brevibacillus brevis]
MDFSEVVEQYKAWLKNPELVSKEAAAAFSEIYKATKSALNVYQDDKAPYGD